MRTARVDAIDHLVVVIAHQAPAAYLGASHYQDMLDDFLGGAEKLMADLESSCERLASVDWEPDIVQGRRDP
ncbi:MAG: hypothetical protein ABW060_18410 [Solirubrobacteraceae bacterium]